MELRLPDPAAERAAGLPESPAPLEPALPTAPSRWNFLTNHAHVLVLIAKHPSIVLREVAARVGLTERAVQRIVHELEQDGFIVRERVGRQNCYQVNGGKNLRHPVEQHCLVRDLLALVACREA